jgi:glyoxylate reductase
MTSQRPRVVLGAPLPSSARDLLDGLDVVEPPDAAAALTPESLAALVARSPGADALIAMLFHPVGAALLDGAPRLRVVANVAVGLDNVDLDAATARGVIVTHTPGVLTDATADLAFGLLLAAARHFSEGEALVRGGRWTGWAPGQLLGAAVAGATLGLIGLGRIGQAVARRARGFDMRVLYHARHPVAREVESALGATRVPLDELLARADFVSIHCPLTPETHHLIGARELARMKASAVLVNTARGPIVDEAALAGALAAGRIAACGLDVFEQEPRVHPDLLASPRAVLLPHLGSATEPARRRMAELAAQSVVDALAGRRPAHVANPSVYTPPHHLRDPPVDTPEAG